MNGIRMAGIPLSELNAEQRRIYDDIVSGPRGNAGGVFMTWLRSPGMADPAQRLGEFVRFNTSLPTRLSELVILIVARHWTSQFEWYFHAPIAAAQGLSADAIEAIREHRTPHFDREDERIVHAFCRALLETHEVPDGLYGEALALLGDVGVVELVGVLGYYVFVALTLRTFGEPLPDGASPPLPPSLHRPQSRAADLPSHGYSSTRRSTGRSHQ